MLRRTFHQATISALLLAATRQAHALSLGDLSGADASNGLKAALAQGAQAAVALLGQPRWLSGQPKGAHSVCRATWKMPPRCMRKSMGQGKRIDELVTSINRCR
jgi:hypothetical protein